MLLGLGAEDLEKLRVGGEQTGVVGDQGRRGRWLGLDRWGDGRGGVTPVVQPLAVRGRALACGLPEGVGSEPVGQNLGVQVHQLGRLVGQLGTRLRHLRRGLRSQRVRARDQGVDVQWSACGLGAHQIGQDECGVANQVDHRRVRRRDPIHHPIEQSLDRLAQIADPGGAHQAPAALQGMEGASQDGDRLPVPGLGPPGLERARDPVDLLIEFLEEDFEQVRRDPRSRLGRGRRLGGWGLSRCLGGRRGRRGLGRPKVLEQRLEPAQRGIGLVEECLVGGLLLRQPLDMQLEGRERPGEMGQLLGGRPTLGLGIAATHQLRDVVRQASGGIVPEHLQGAGYARQASGHLVEVGGPGLGRGTGLNRLFDAGQLALGLAKGGDRELSRWQSGVGCRGLGRRAMLRVGLEHRLDGE